MDAQILTIREYAEARQVSYETARRWVSESEETLQGHIIKEHGKRCLDEVAQSILDVKNIGSQLQTMEEDTLAGVEKLKRENEDLKNHIADLQGRLLRAQEQIIQEKEQSEALRIELEQVKALEVQYTEQSQAAENPETDPGKSQNEPTEKLISRNPDGKGPEKGLDGVQDLTSEEPETVKASGPEIDREALKEDIRKEYAAIYGDAYRQAAEDIRKAMEAKNQAHPEKKPFWRRLLGL